ncbi:hypothetical protein KBC75_03770 [Candidatus Shapirobacteria bacterium]|nr:hypothetical protein [Candidatus Shapirobacteria bacterium]
MELSIQRTRHDGRRFVNAGGILRFTSEIAVMPDLRPNIAGFITENITWIDGIPEFTIRAPSRYSFAPIRHPEPIQGMFAYGSTFRVYPDTKVVLSSDTGVHKLRIKLVTDL